ncbi:MAG: hypothetical protein IJD30_00400 [Clostridia bacterium]|nr:hypothetical protein [Clostridia bacterium]
MKKLFVFLHVFLICGCVTVIDSTVLMPAKSPEVIKYNTVAVLPLKSSKGHDYTLMLESAIKSAHSEGNKIYTVVDRANIDKILKEQTFQMTIADPDTIVEMGRLLGVSAIWTGTSTGKLTTSRYSEERTRCYQSGGCYNYTMSCVNRIFTAIVSLKLINVSTGEVIYSNTLSDAAIVGDCPDEPRYITDYDLEEMAVLFVLDRLIQDIAPYKKQVKFELMTDTNGIDDSYTKDLFKESIEMAKNNKIGRACEYWQEIYGKYPNALSAGYNLSLCFEIKSEFEQAINLLEALKVKGVKVSQRVIIDDAIYRNRENIKNASIISEQLGG